MQRELDQNGRFGTIAPHIVESSLVSDHPYRLPRHVVPSHYRMRLEPDIDAATFTGSEIIDIEVTEATSEITLNAIELDIYEAHVRNTAEHHVEATVSYDEERQRAILTLDEEIAPGSWQVFCGFSGILNDQLHGFYKSTFTDVDGNEQGIATTQFEATDARRAFPCWDEPDFKASFGVTLIVPDHLLAVSNGAEIAREAAGDGKVAITYADTMTMSTYLVAFVVGDFEATDPIDVDGVPLRIIAPRGKLHLTDFALESADFCLRYLAEYYEIPYPGDKVDMVAIPDFAFGAMENLGCITYRETALLADVRRATQQELLRILDVIAHELAHMWFGDLVTMKWWNGIWLNEAFATFMETKATDARRPDWKRWLAFGAVERPWAYGVDGLATSRPVEFEVNSPEEANEMFDALTYGKGSSVLRMIEQYLGEDDFRHGVGTYLKTHAYGNTETADLWAGLNQASGEPVGEIMDTWILQAGYPALEVNRSAGGIELSQSRFLLMADETDTTMWKLPVQIRGVAGGTPFERKILLDSPTATVDLGDAVDWAIANAGGHGFYRTWYEDSLYGALFDELETLEDLERFVLVDDAWAFVEAGTATARSYVMIVDQYRHEHDQAIWQTVLGGLGGLSHHVVGDQDRARFEGFVRDLLGATVDRLGWDVRADDDDLTRRLRGQMVGAMGRLANDADTIDRSRSVARAWIADPDSVDSDLGQAAVFTLARHGDQTVYNDLWTAHDAASTPQEQLKFLQAISLMAEGELAHQTLDNIRGGRVRSQDASWVTAQLMGHRVAGADVWKQVRQDWDGLTAKMPPMTIRRVVDGLPALSQPEVAADIQAFFAEHPLPAAAKALAQNLEKLQAMVALRQREQGNLGL